MSDYGGHTWVNGVDATNQTRMNAIEQGIVGTPGMYFLTSLVQLSNNQSISSGSTSTKTCTGVGTPTIPSAATAVILNAFFDGDTIGTFLSFAPHSASFTGYPIVGSTQITGTGKAMCGTVIVPLSSGQIDIKANGGNASNINVWIMGYIH